MAVWVLKFITYDFHRKKAWQTKDPRNLLTNCALMYSKLARAQPFHIPSVTMHNAVHIALTHQAILALYVFPQHKRCLRALQHCYYVPTLCISRSKANIPRLTNEKGTTFHDRTAG